MVYRLSWLLIFCHFVAFLFLLLVSLSLPILKPLYLVQFKGVSAQSQPSTSIATLIRFGIWGFCATSALNEPTPFTNNGECTPIRLGYVLDPAVLDLTGNPQIAQAILQGLTVIFILHPIAAGIALLSLIPSYPAARSHFWGIIALILGLVGALLTTVVLAVDFLIIDQMRIRIKPLTHTNFDVQFGNCAWFVVVAAIMLWASVVVSSMVVCNCFGYGAPIREASWNGNDDEKN